MSENSLIAPTDDQGSDLTVPSGSSATVNICNEYLQNPRHDKEFIDRFASVLYSDRRARGICRVRALKNGVDLNGVEDVTQRVMETFFSKMLPKIRQADAIYAVIYAIADNISHEVFRDHTTMSQYHDSIEVMVERGEEITQTGLVEEEEIDRDLALDVKRENQRFMRDLEQVQKGEVKVSNSGVFPIDPVPFISFVPESKKPDEAIPDRRLTENAVKNPSAKGRRKGGGRAVLSADQAELVQISEAIQARNNTYAQMLGIGLPTLSSYIYGRTATVPAPVMQRARQLLKEFKETSELVNRKFDKPMSEILASWRQRIEAAKDNNSLAAFLGVSTMTLHRWSNNETRPDTTSLVRYEQIVLNEESRVRNLKRLSLG